MSEQSHLHAGHRQRMKERFLATGLDSFSPHEIIELMLFYAIPQRDVNDLSHRLIERFGSLSGVLDADYNDLLSVDGVGQNVSVLFRLMNEVMRAYAIDGCEISSTFDTIEKIGQYAVNLFTGVTVERAYSLMFDNKMKLIDAVLVAEGTVNSVSLQPRVIIEKALKRDASSVLLAHNHPNGTSFPSSEDITMTATLEQLFDIMGITFIDHLVVSGKYFTPVIGAKAKRFFSAGNPLEKLESFYGSEKASDTEPDKTSINKES